YNFFQAEDSIRDSSLTGVQTCALPILIKSGGFGAVRIEPPVATGRPEIRKMNMKTDSCGRGPVWYRLCVSTRAGGQKAMISTMRSEERRVGEGVEWGMGGMHSRGVGGE